MQDTVIAVTYRGVRTAVSKERLIELLRREEAFLNAKTQSGGRPRLSAAGHEPSGEPTSLRGRQLELTKVTHASLSSRIKKVYMYSAATKALRPAHLGLLQELIANFDWVIPQYPNTRLEQHLGDIKTWSGVPDAFAAE